MNTKILGQSKNTLRLEVSDGNHEVLHLLVQELLKDKDVAFAAYRKDHQLFETYTLLIKTNKKDAKTLLNKTIMKLCRDVTAFKKDLKGS